MKLNEDVVPTNLNEAVKLLKKHLTKKDKEYIRKPGSSPYQCHFEFGMTIRNNWSLWDKDTILVKWFKETYDINHADDISGIILECLWNDVRKEPRRDKILAERFKDHWKLAKEIEKSGKRMVIKIDNDGNIETEIENQYYE